MSARGHELDAGVAEERALAVAPGDMCEILSTSGTTGTPEGVVLDHAQVLRAYWDWSEIVTFGPGDRYPVIAPFSHGFGPTSAARLRAAGRDADPGRGLRPGRAGGRDRAGSG